MPTPKRRAPWRLFAVVPTLAAVLVAAPAVGAQDVDVAGDSAEGSGSVSETAIEINADGGVAISDASSGDRNLADPSGSGAARSGGGAGDAGEGDAAADDAAQRVGSVLQAQGVAGASPEAVQAAIADLGLDGTAIGAKDALLLGEYLAGPLTEEQRIGVETAFQTVAAGNGGTASANADGGSIAVGDINSGGNEGNTIEIGDVGVPAVEEAEEEVAPAPEEKKAKKEVKVAPAPVADKEAAPVVDKKAAPVEEQAAAPVEEAAVVVAAAPEEEAVVEVPAPVPAPAPAPASAPAEVVAPVAAPVVALPSTGVGPAAIAGWDFGSAGFFGLLAAATAVVGVALRRVAAR